MSECIRNCKAVLKKFIKFHEIYKLELNACITREFVCQKVSSLNLKFLFKIFILSICVWPEHFDNKSLYKFLLNVLYNMYIVVVDGAHYILH